MSFSRHSIRVAAFQALFALATTPDAEKSELYQTVLKLQPNEEVPAYLTTLVDGVMTNQEEIDAAIAKHLAPGWRLSRLPRPSLIILRLATYELQEKLAPAPVVINEALEVAKDFTDEASRKFINGVLGSMTSESAPA